MKLILICSRKTLLSCNNFHKDFLSDFRFVRNAYDNDYKATIGVDFEVERFKILDQDFNLQMYANITIYNNLIIINNH